MTPEQIKRHAEEVLRDKGSTAGAIYVAEAYLYMRESQTSPPPPPMRFGCQQCGRLRDQLRQERVEVARLTGELQAYRILDAAGRIDRD